MRPVITGDNIRLRPLRPEDEATFARIYTSPALTRYLGVDQMTPEQAGSLFEDQLRGGGRKHTFAITTPDDPRMQGVIGLLVEDFGSNAMITGLVIIPRSPISGYGSEAGRLLLTYAFGALGLHRVWAGHREDHDRMRNIMLDAGLEPEAILRELFHTQNRWHDVVTYAALTDSWCRAASELELALLRGAVTTAAR